MPSILSDRNTLSGQATQLLTLDFGFSEEYCAGSSTSDFGKESASRKSILRSWPASFAFVIGHENIRMDASGNRDP